MASLKFFGFLKEKYFLLSITLVCYFASFSQTGIPFIHNYDPEIYESTPQVWAITQDNRGIMYFAAQGVLEFDGVKWRTINVPGNKTVRSLATDTISNTVYVGGIGDFGFLQPDSTGNLHYVSLSDNLDSTDKIFFDVWKTEAGKDGIYFSTDNALFRYSLEAKKHGKKALTVWKNKQFFLLYNIKGDIYTGVRRKGIVKVMGDSLVALPGNKNLQKELTWFMLPYEGNKILFGNQRGGLTVYDPSTPDTSNYFYKAPYFDPKYIAKTDSFLYENQLYGGTKLSNGNYALATIRSGIIIVNKHGKIIDHIYLENGLQSQTVHYLFQDRQNGLWAALTYGISRVEINSPIRQWNKLTGISGSIYNVIRNNNNIYASSNLGLFIKKNQSFYPIEALTGPNAIQCFVLENIKFPDGQDQFLACATNGIYQVNYDVAKAILPITTFQLYQSPANPNICYVADENQLISIIYKNEKWAIDDTLYLAKDYPSAFCIDNKSQFWFLDEGVPYMFPLGKIDKIQDYSTYKKDDKLEFNFIKNFNNEIIFLTNKGIWKIDTVNKYFYKDTSMFNGILNKKDLNILQFEKVNNNEIWLNIKREKRNSIFIVRNLNQKPDIDSIPFKRLPNFDEFRTDGDSIIWVISSKSLFEINLKTEEKVFVNENVLNRWVFINNDSVIFKGAYYKTTGDINFTELKQSVNQIPYLDYDFNNISFEYALPSFDDETKNQFSYCLIKDNGSENWSAWTNETKKEYTNLSDGEYTFKVRAKNIYGIISEPSEYKFVILTPWFKSFLAYFFYFLISITILFLIIRLYTIRLKKKNLLLEKIVRERTHEIWEKKEEIADKAKKLKDSNELLLQRNLEINQQNEEIAAQRDNLQILTENLKQYNEEVRAQNDELLNQRNIVQSQKELLELINLDIKSSIEYAKRIQTSALPDPEILSRCFSDYFIFFKPRDIVSGDFYWFAHVENQTVIAAADCTGHGVPGALMSILGMSLLKEIVVGEYITHPGVILRKLRKGIIESLKQTEESSGQDGMDISLICIDEKTNLLQYAGANNSLYLIRDKSSESNPYPVILENETTEFIEIKADNMPVGIYLKMDRFTSHEIQLYGNEKIYLFSDGFADQFGGTDSKKYKYKAFRKLLFNHSHLSMKQQYEIIEKEFHSWKGENEQIDDLVIIGIESGKLDKIPAKI